MAKKTAAKGSAKKRSVSGKRGTPSQKKRRSGGTDARGVIGIVITCLGLLSLAGQFIPSSGGFLRACNDLTHGLGGVLCLLLPLVVCWAGVALIFARERRMSLRSAVCGVLIFLFVEALLQLFQVNAINMALLADGGDAGYLSFLARSYLSSTMDWSHGGGLLGALLAWPLVQALDIWGSVIALIFASVIALMVLTGVSTGRVGMVLSEWLDDLRVQIGERREERQAMREAREEEELERESQLAQERASRRMQREQSRLEEQEEDEPELIELEPPAPVRAKKPAARAKKAAPKVRQTVEAPQMDGQSVTPAPRPRLRPVRPIEETPLYIEREDEFEPVGPEERRRRRAGFTMEEAEQAFLYGVNSTADATFSGYGDDSGARQADASAQDAYAASQSGYAGQAAYAAPKAEEAAQGGYAPQGTYDDPQQSAYAQRAAYGDPSQSGFEGQNMYPDDDAPDAFDDEAQDLYAQQTAYDDAPQDQYNQSAYGARDGYAERRAPAGGAAVANGASTAGGSFASSGVPSSIPAGGVRAAQRPAQASFSSRDEDGAQGETIVQLRGSRLDGTPIVIPKKEEHEVPKAAQVYNYPPLDLLSRGQKVQDVNQRAKDEAGAAKLLQTLESFGVQAKLTHVTHGPAITRYELQPAPGVKVSRIVNLVDDIALNMAADGVRIEAPIPGKPAVGIEIPNEKIETVSLRDVLESEQMQREESPTAVALGKGISGAPVIADMAKMPHVLIAGATGSGKSVCINTIINSIIYRASPREVRLILIDPKVVELSVYNGIPHLLVPVVTDPKKASAALSWAVVEMEHRYKRFETMGVRDIKGYNKAIGPDEEPMSKIIVIIDELADLMMVAPGEVEESICRLAQLARAAGIHLVIATQRPSVNVITGVIKANIPSRIAFAVSSQIDSRTILDSGGAEKLLGKGDMLYAPQGAGKPTRVQGCFLSDDEVQRIVDHVRGQHEAEYSEDVMEQMNSAAEEEKAEKGDAPGGGEPVDEMLAKAIELAIDAGQVSISMLQRRLRVGYARAGRLVDEMTLRGITGEAEGPTKPRTVLITREEWRRMQENGD